MWMPRALDAWASLRQVTCLALTEPAAEADPAALAARALLASSFEEVRLLRPAQREHFGEWRVDLHYASQGIFWLDLAP